MARAHRIYAPGYVWHLTHRCHNRDFLLDDSATRWRWIYWLRKAKTSQNLSVLDYCVTSNHIHLLVSDNGPRRAIPRAMQLVAGRLAQEYNETHSRRGAFWEDRYHATAVDTQAHLLACIAYIELNMVRAGVVKDPMDWPQCGYQEIREPRPSDGIIDHNRLMALLKVSKIADLGGVVDTSVQESVRRCQGREGKWSDALAVGGQTFLENFKSSLDLRGYASRRSFVPSGDAGDVLVVREDEPPFEANESGSRGVAHSADDISTVFLAGDNSYLWDEGEDDSPEE